MVDVVWKDWLVCPKCGCQGDFGKFKFECFSIGANIECCDCGHKWYLPLKELVEVVDSEPASAVDSGDGGSG